MPIQPQPCHPASGAYVLGSTRVPATALVTEPKGVQPDVKRSVTAPQRDQCPCVPCRAPMVACCLPSPQTLQRARRALWGQRARFWFLAAHAKSVGDTHSHTHSRVAACRMVQCLGALRPEGSSIDVKGPTASAPQLFCPQWCNMFSVPLSSPG